MQEHWLWQFWLFKIEVDQKVGLIGAGWVLLPGETSVPNENCRNTFLHFLYFHNTAYPALSLQIMSFDSLIYVSIFCPHLRHLIPSFVDLVGSFSQAKVAHTEQLYHRKEFSHPLAFTFWYGFVSQSFSFLCTLFWPMLHPML